MFSTTTSGWPRRAIRSTAARGALSRPTPTAPPDGTLRRSSMCTGPGPAGDLFSAPASGTFLPESSCAGPPRASTRDTCTCSRAIPSADGSVQDGSALLGRGHPRRQLQDADVAEVDLRAFRFQAQVTFLLRSMADAVHEFPVHRQLDHAVHGHHIVDVPLSAALAAVLDRHAAGAARRVGDNVYTAHAEQFAVYVGQRS